MQHIESNDGSHLNYSKAKLTHRFLSLIVAIGLMLAFFTSCGRAANSADNQPDNVCKLLPASKASALLGDRVQIIPRPARFHECDIASLGHHGQFIELVVNAISANSPQWRSYWAAHIQEPGHAIVQVQQTQAILVSNSQQSGQGGGTLIANWHSISVFVGVSGGVSNWQNVATGALGEVLLNLK